MSACRATWGPTAAAQQQPRQTQQMEGAGGNRGIFDRFAGLLQALRPNPVPQLQAEDYTTPTAGQQQARGYVDASAAAAALQVAGHVPAGASAVNQPAAGE